MRNVPVHFGVVRRAAFGGEIRTSRCGRIRTQADGMNLTDAASEVTCKFCLKIGAVQAAAEAERGEG